MTRSACTIWCYICGQYSLILNRDNNFCMLAICRESEQNNTQNNILSKILMRNNFIQEASSKAMEEFKYYRIS